MSRSGLFVSLLLTLALTACGGGSGSVVSSSSGTDTGTGTTTDPDVSIGLGSGSGTAFEEGSLALSASSVLLGNSVTVTVAAVDKNDSNTTLSDSYLYVFSSGCSSLGSPTARFSTAKTYSSSGSVSSNYINDGCTGSDTITVSLYSASATPGTDAALATATAEVQAVVPQLGYSSGVDYRDGLISGALNLVGASETVLTANAVNPIEENSLVASSAYSVAWSSSCDDGTFSIASQTLANSTIETRYDGNLTTCLGDNTITLRLYRTDAPGIVLDSTSTVVNIAATVTGGTVVVPSLGTGTGTSFREGNLTLSAVKSLTGDDITVSVNAVDKNADNTLLSNSYQYVFSSDCVLASTASFTAITTINSSGTVSSIYRADSPACTGDDTITVSLFNSGADTATASPLAVASGVVRVATPVLGTGTGSSFREGSVSGTTVMEGIEETVLTAVAVDPLNSNSQVSNPNYDVIWTATCGSFSVASQDLTSGSISTRYDATLAACEGTQTLTLTLSYNAQELDSLTVQVEISSGAVLEDINEALGSGSGASYYDKSITLSTDRVLTGDTLDLSVTGVDLNNNNGELKHRYQYVFESECSKLGTASFTIKQTFSSINESTGNYINSIASTYRNLTCEGGDTITVKLFEETADPAFATALATATTVIDTAKPMLGSGSGSAFNEDKVTGALILSGEDETEFTVNLVNPLRSNALVADADYIAEWQSSCESSEFSIQKQTLETGVINTRYITDTVNCLSEMDGSDPDSRNSITLIVYERNNICTFDDITACVGFLTFDVSVQEGLAPTLGVIDDESFYSELLVNGYRESEYPLSDTDLEDAISPARADVYIVANVVDANNGYSLISGTSYGMTITSSCYRDGTASFDSVEKISSSGVIFFTYTPDTCEEDHFEVNLYKVANGELTTLISTKAITGLLYVHPITVGAITYSGTSAEAISIATIGDPVLPKLSTLTFTVVDASNQPVIGKLVDFKLTNSTGGIYLASDSDVTDVNGQVTVILNAGSSHAVTSVRATVATEDKNGKPILISTSSQPISITTGIADQDSFQISIDTFNPPAYNVNGEEVTVTAYVADQYQNPVANGTIVNFTAESGIIGSSCTTTAGVCSVKWISGGVRPGKSNPSLQRVNDIDPQSRTYDGWIEDDDCKKTICGMTTITAYTQGEGGFTDTNGNGEFDVLASGEPEPYVAYSEVVRDDDWSDNGALSGTPSKNESGQYVEYYADFNSNGAFDMAPASGYQGVVCSDSAISAGGGHCDNMMHVRSSARIVQSVAGVPKVRFFSYDGDTDMYTEITGLPKLESSGEFYVLLQDINGNAPAFGTAFGVVGDGFKIYGDSGEVENSIGLLYKGKDNGLPSFGSLYYVKYLQVGTAISLTLTATYETSSVAYTLLF
jgi:hypothetical protein